MRIRIREIFPEILEKVKNSHEEFNLIGHHDFVHALRVAEITYLIGLDEYEKRTAELAGIAGLCHNADRILQKKFNIGRKEVSEELVRELIMSQIQGADLTSTQVDMIIKAILGHDGKNSSEDSKVLIVLMDADRVVNLDADLFPRSGQYYHDLPVVDYRHFLEDPKATYKEPRSVLKDISFSLEWADPNSFFCVRTQLGKQMAEDRARIFKEFFVALKKQLTEEGIYPYPF